jgi:cytochrome c biogenesis protein CcdA
MSIRDTASANRGDVAVASEAAARRVVGISLFLVVTACWMLGLASAEQDWVRYADLVLLIAVGLSAVSAVITGYLGRIRDALWLGWIPGAAMIAIGFAMTPEPGGDERGGGMVFFGGLVLAFGWPLYFFPLIAAGAGLQARRARRPSPVAS